MWANRPSSPPPCLPYGRNACENITAPAQLCRAFDFVKRICKIRRVLLPSSGKIHTLPMSFGALKNQPKQKSGRAIALPAPPPPRSLIANQISIRQHFDIDYPSGELPRGRPEVLHPW